MRGIILFLLGILSMPVSALEDFDYQEIEQRIKPVGQVRLQQTQQQQTTQPVKAKEEVAKKEEPGQATYEQFCAVCHRDGLAGAPKFRDATWKPRLEAKKNIDGLVVSAIKGLNAMPPKGTCVDCSNEEMKNAIQYMLPKS